MKKLFFTHLKKLHFLYDTAKHASTMELNFAQCIGKHKLGQYYFSEQLEHKFLLKFRDL